MPGPTAGMGGSSSGHHWADGAPSSPAPALEGEPLQADAAPPAPFLAAPLGPQPRMGRAACSRPPLARSPRTWLLLLVSQWLQAPPRLPQDQPAPPPPPPPCPPAPASPLALVLHPLAPPPPRAPRSRAAHSGASSVATAAASRQVAPWGAQGTPPSAQMHPPEHEGGKGGRGALLRS